MWRCLLLTGLTVVISLLAICCLWALESGEDKQMLRASEFKDFSEAISKAKSKTLVIDQPQPITSNLTIPSDVHLALNTWSFVTWLLKAIKPNRQPLLSFSPFTEPWAGYPSEKS